MNIIKLTEEHNKTLLSNNSLIFKFSFIDNWNEDNELVERYITFSNDENDEIVGGVFDLHDINGYWLDKRDYYNELSRGIEQMVKAKEIFHGHNISDNQAQEFYNDLFLKHRETA